METLVLHDYVHILRRHFKVFLGIVFLCTLLGVLLTYLIPVSYSSSIDVYVRHKGTANSQLFYTYDGYYSTQASVQYTDTVAGFLQSLSTVDDAANLVQKDPLYKSGDFQPAELTDQADYLASFQRNINVKIVAPQLVNVSVHDNSPVVAQLWAQSLGTVLTANLKQLNQEGDANFTIDTIHAPITETNKLNLYIDTAIGLIIGVFMGFTIGFILEAYKE